VRGIFAVAGAAQCGEARYIALFRQQGLQLGKILLRVEADHFGGAE
jgi:hypothetical protein